MYAPFEMYAYVCMCAQYFIHVGVIKGGTILVFSEGNPIMCLPHSGYALLGL